MSSPSKNSTDPLRPADHIDSDEQIKAPTLGVVGWLRWGWRQLTSMRTAIVLLLMLAIAAIPGSIFPQRMADPNGVVAWQERDPELFKVLDWFKLFDVYLSPWFSAIYLLLFVSLIGCIIPRTKHHYRALRAKPPRTPARLSRLADYREDLFEAPGDLKESAEHAVDLAAKQLKSGGYRVQRFDNKTSYSVSAERGYARETGNLLFHVSLLGILVTVGIGGGFAYTGQSVIREGETFVNSLLSYSSMNKGRFVADDALSAYAVRLNSFDVTYQDNGQAGDFSANISVKKAGEAEEDTAIRVNHPVNFEGDRIYLLGNGYAPTITVRNADGDVVFRDDVPFLAQDNNMTSLGIVKITDGMPEQMGLQGFFYPTAVQKDDGAFTSQFPDLINPLLTLDVYVGDLGIDDGTPRNVYTLQTDKMEKVAGRNTDVKALMLAPGETVDLPNGLGTVTFENATGSVSSDVSKSVKRYVSLQFHHDPSATFVLVFAILSMVGLGMALFIPRRRVWVRAQADGSHVKLEYAGLARGEDPLLAEAIEDFATKHQTALTTQKVD